MNNDIKPMGKIQALMYKNSQLGKSLGVAKYIEIKYIDHAEFKKQWKKVLAESNVTLMNTDKIKTAEVLGLSVRSL